MKECYKRKSHVSRKLYVIYIYIYSNNVRPPVIKTFTTLHTTTFHFSTLVDTSLSLI
jgi:hypothetical protein